MVSNWRFFEGDYIRFKKKTFQAAFIAIFYVFFMIFLVQTTFLAEHSSFTSLRSHNSTQMDSGKIYWWFGKKSKRRSPFGLFESCREIQFSFFLVSGLGKLVFFSGRTSLRMKFIAKKKLNLLFQMTPSRILCDQ